MACHLRWLTVSRPRIETLIIAEGERRKGGGHGRKRKRERELLCRGRNFETPRRLEKFRRSSFREGRMAARLLNRGERESDTLFSNREGEREREREKREAKRDKREGGRGDQFLPLSVHSYLSL